MRVDHRQIERRGIDIAIGKRNEDSAIESRISLEDLICRLVGEPRVRTSHRQRSVSEVQLREPRDKRWLSCSCRGDIAVVGSNGLARLIPCQVDLATGESEGVITVARDGRAAVVAGCVLVHTGLVFGDLGIARIAGAVADSLPVLSGVGVDSVTKVSFDNSF
jgi:hypothetical protein